MLCTHAASSIHSGWSVVLDVAPHAPPEELRTHLSDHGVAPGNFVVVVHGALPLKSLHRDLPPHEPLSPVLPHIHKIAAHCDPSEVATSQVQETLAIACADEAAKAATFHYQPKVPEAPLLDWTSNLPWPQEEHGHGPQRGIMYL